MKYIDIIKETTIANFRGKAGWWNTNKGFVYLQKMYHNLDVVYYPEKFGLTTDDIISISQEVKSLIKRNEYVDVDSDISECDDITHWMIENGWVKFSIQNNLDLSVDAKTTRILQSFLNSLEFKIKSVWYRIYNPYKEGVLEHDYLEFFIKRGFLKEQCLNEEVVTSGKWWYNTKNKQAVKVSMQHHCIDVFDNSQKYGYTKNIINKNSIATREYGAYNDSKRAYFSYDEGLMTFMLNEHWVRVVIKQNDNSVCMECADLRDAQKTLQWITNSLIPDIVLIDLRSEEDLSHYSLDNYNDIEYFIKRGFFRRKLGESKLKEYQLVDLEKYEKLIGTTKKAKEIVGDEICNNRKLLTKLINNNNPDNLLKAAAARMILRSI